MKGSCLSMNKIYGESKIDSLKRRIDFISSKRKKNWPVIETKLLQANTKNTETAQEPFFQEHPKNMSHIQQKSIEMQRKATHSKSRSVQLMDLKSRRYHECKQNSQRIFKKIQLQRMNEIQTKKLMKMRVTMQSQRRRELLSNFEEAKIKDLQQSNMKSIVDDALVLKTVEMQQSLIKEQEQQLRLYENELSYRSEVMRKIKEMIDKGS